MCSTEHTSTNSSTINQSPIVDDLQTFRQALVMNGREFFSLNFFCF